jgi:serine protease
LFPTTPNLKVALRSTNPYVEILQPDLALGNVNTMQKVNNQGFPFRLALQRNIPKDTEVVLRLDYEDNGKTDRQFIAIVINPSYYVINRNSMTTSIGSIGRIGYEDTGKQTGGVGFVYNGTPMLYELGLLMGISPTKVPNTVRSVGNSNIANDFTAVNFVSEVLPSKVSAYDLQGIFNDNGANSRKIGLTVNYKSFVWAGVPNDKFFIVEYTLRNTSGAALNDLAIGLFADWDISENGAEDQAKWDNENRMGYIYHNVPTGQYGGIQLLNTNLTPNYYAIENDDDLNVGVYTSNTDKGFTDAEKYKTLSNGLSKITAGDKEPKGKDVSHVVAANGIKLAANDSIKVAFAFMGGDNLQDLKNSAKAAAAMYNQTMKAPQPIVNSLTICPNSRATLTATGASKFNWYNSITGGKPIGTGNTYTTSALTTDSTFYVANADQPFESIRTAANVSLATSGQVSVSGSLNLCKGEKVRLTAPRGETFLWSTGATSRSIVVEAAGSYTVRTRSQNPACEITSAPVLITEKASPTADFASSLSTVDLKDNKAITFTDRSTDAVQWKWDFGGGLTSTERNPTVTYTKFGDFVVSLSVTAANGCTATVRKPFVVTGIEDLQFAAQTKLYPNPNEGNFVLSLNNQIVGDLQLKIYNTLGVLVWEKSYAAQEVQQNLAIALPQLAAGLYTVQLNNANKQAVKKMMITR